MQFFIGVDNEGQSAGYAALYANNLEIKVGIYQYDRCIRLYAGEAHWESADEKMYSGSAK